MKKGTWIAVSLLFLSGLIGWVLIGVFAGFSVEFSGHSNLKLIADICGIIALFTFPIASMVDQIIRFREYRKNKIK